MRYAFVRENTVEFIEDSGIPLSQKYHSGIHHYFIPIPEGQDVQIGYYHNDSVFTKPMTWGEAEAQKSRIETLEATTLALMDTIIGLQGGMLNV